MCIPLNLAKRYLISVLDLKHAGITIGDSLNRQEAST